MNSKHLMFAILLAGISAAMVVCLAISLAKGVWANLSSAPESQGVIQSDTFLVQTGFAQSIVYRFVDDDAGVVCYSSELGRTDFVLSCVPLQETNLGDK